MSDLKVSVVMAVYNGEAYLKETIQCILEQTYPDFEFIIVDDGSTDGTWEILTRFAEVDHRIVLLHNQPNQGVVRALNRGLDASEGVLIARQDADDISLPQRLARQVEFLEDHADYGCIGVAVQLVEPDGTPIGIGYDTPDNESIQKKLIENMCICGPTIMVRRECLEAIDFYFSDGLNASEDYDLCLRLAEVTKLAVIQEPLYLYRQHTQSASRTQEQRQAFNKAVALERAIYRRHGSSPASENFMQVGVDYLRAAIIAAARKDTVFARESLNHALHVYPLLFDKDQPLEELVRAYTPAGTIEIALAYTMSVFDDVLPKTRRLRRMRSRLLAYLHMSEVFDGAKQNQLWRVESNLLPGIRHDPTWLLNLGVISILFKNTFKHHLTKMDR